MREVNSICNILTLQAYQYAVCCCTDFTVSQLSCCIAAGVSRGKGQDLFLKAFHEALEFSQVRKLKVPPMRAVIVGSDMSAQTKFETELRNFVADKKIQDKVKFVNKTLNVAPYLASIDVLVQNSQVLVL